MREIVFLQQNADKWKKIESHLNGRERLNPDLLADVFVQLTDDLSYARTFYPDSNTMRYLNGLTAKVHQRLYRNKKEKKSRLWNFFRFEYPLLIGSAHKEVLVSFSIFSLATLIGVVSTLYDDTFVRLILGDSYVNMTLENIRQNDPMAVYKQMHGIDMFMGITVNNIQVSFMAFAAGVLLSFGTGFILFQNGVMLGAFHAFFYQKGLLTTAVKSIWLHGTLEISAIVIAGAAGLVIGNSLLFPGTFTRRQAFLAGARKGMKMVIGMVPVFVIAGFLEGFVTRHTDLPPALNLAIILSSLVLFIFYVGIYPRWVILRRRRQAQNPIQGRGLVTFKIGVQCFSIATHRVRKKLKS
ncbi:MAG: stage II sporulation protein M, partial [bacterium]